MGHLGNTGEGDRHRGNWTVFPLDWKESHWKEGDVLASLEKGADSLLQGNEKTVKTTLRTQSPPDAK